MTTENTVPEGETKETPKNNFMYRTVRTLTLASVGAISISREELKRLLDRLVERGELDAKQARKLLKEAELKGRARHHRNRHKKTGLSTNENGSMPTHSELEALQKQLTRLNAELEELHSLTTASAEQRQTDSIANM